MFSRCLLWDLQTVVPRNVECFQLHSLKSTHRQFWLSARSHCSDLECIHNIFLLFARRKMVLVIVSCWLAPLQSRSKWVLFSFRSCESDAFPPCLGITAKHMHWNPSWSSVCQMIILLQRVCPGLLYLFFSFCHLSVCPLWWEHRHWWCWKKAQVCIEARLAILGLVNDHKLLQRKAVPQAPVTSAQCCLSCCSTNELWPNSVVPCVFSTVYSFFFLVDCFIVWCAVAVCHTFVTGLEEVFHLFA